MRSNTKALALATLLTLAIDRPAFGSYAQTAGRPAARPLPTYCQMGECTITTVEATDPVAYAQHGVLIRVESQNWYSNTLIRKGLSRGADTVSYVLCSKQVPAVVTEMGEHKFLVDFLAPDDDGSYSHANETIIAMYFVVCHARSFADDLFQQGPRFASSLGYQVRARPDQPIISDPEKVLDFLK